jgi:hypothetical protein
VRWRPALVYLPGTAIGAILFVGFSMVNKKAGGGGGQFLGGYTWGAYGYYEGLSNFRFFLRLFFVNAVGLLPLVCWWLWKTGLCICKTPRRGWTSLLPLAMALAEVVAMRNYFCHHPWMASPVFIAGLVFSLAAQVTQAAEEEAASTALKWPIAAMACTFLYGLAVLAIFRAAEAEVLSLTHLVRTNVPRTESLVIVKTLDPTTAGLAERLAYDVDRRVVVVETLNDLPSERPLTILSSCPVGDLQLVAGTGADTTGLASQAASWLSRTVAHRKVGDKIQFAAHYYLYRPNP